MGQASGSSPPGRETGGGAALPPARLLRLHRHSLTHVLIVGGTSAMRDRVARAFHGESRLGGGPFVGCDCASEETRLRVALLAWAGMGSPEANPYREAERGALYLDQIERLGLETQHLLLEIAGPLQGGPERGEGSGPGRLLTGNPRPLTKAVAAGRFLAPLHDTLDKVRVEL